MLLKDKNSESLLTDLKNFVHEERKILGLILHYLKEVELRRLHLKMGYPNLYAFCMKELGYSEASAHRRISAMRLMREIPDIEAKIQNGTLNLSVISQAQTFFRRQKAENKALDVEAKKEVLSNLEHKTIRESEKFLLSLSPESPLPLERQKAVDVEHTEIRIVLDQRALNKLESVRARLSHKNPSMAEIFEMGLDLLSKASEAKSEKPISNGSNEVDALLPPQRSQNLSSSTSSRYIPRKIKQAIDRRDQRKCQYKDPQTGRLCGSSFYLQYDHVQPMALGGRTELKNLRLLCSNHNKLMWQERCDVKT